MTIDYNSYIILLIYMTQACYYYADRLGQRALVGKVNMDMSAPDYYRETTEQSLDETER
jgi:cytosine/adenosine deaminase-related metal-dependent hydrolase